jgi:hypothetical protein
MNAPFRKPGKHLLLPTTHREWWLRQHWLPRHTAWLDRTADAFRARLAQQQAAFQARREERA